MNTQTTTEDRYTVENWEPEFHVRSKGTHMSRKVVTPKGVARFSVDFDSIAKRLRQGYEVRLVGHDNRDAVRLIPILTTDCREMHVKAQTMGLFATSTYNGLKFTLKRRNRTIRPEDGAEMQSEKMRKQSEMRKVYRELKEVTPDLSVTCPNCGTTFRIGRKMAA